jgi:sugar phosphate isomerase/epimerase
MAESRLVFSVFTKPWKDLPPGDLGAFVKGLGFDAIEFPLRPGYQVEPPDAERGLPALTRSMAECGLRVASIAGPTDERTFAACAAAGIPVIRVMFQIRDEPYMEAELRIRRHLDTLVPFCERYGVTVGIQNHSEDFVANAMGVRRLVDGHDPRHIAAIWDAAHNALSGEEPELGLDIVWSHLCMVNLKNAFWRRVNGPEAVVAQWEHYYTSGRQGIASWPRIAGVLVKRGYHGVICLTAEYSAEDQVDRLTCEDLVFARSLFEGGSR